MRARTAAEQLTTMEQQPSFSAAVAVFEGLVNHFSERIAEDILQQRHAAQQSSQSQAALTQGIASLAKVLQQSSFAAAGHRPASFTGTFSQQPTAAPGGSRSVEAGIGQGPLVGPLFNSKAAEACSNYIKSGGKICKHSLAPPGCKFNHPNLEPAQ